MKSKKKHNKYIEWFFNRPKTTSILTFLFLSYIVGFVVLLQYRVIKENEQRQMDTILHVIQQNIEQSLKNCYTTSLTLALTIGESGIPKNFDYVSKSLIATNPNIHTVQLVPKGIIKYIYPMAGNEEAMNLNILTSSHLKTEAFRSIITRKMYFAGPLELKQGGMGVVGRFPIYQDNQFWGFSAVILKLETLLKSSGIATVDQSKYYFQLSKYNPTDKTEIFYLPKKENFDDAYKISVRIPDGDWKLYLVSKNQNYLTREILIPGIVGIILAALFALVIFTLLKMPNKLRSLVNKQAKKLMTSEIKFKAIFDQAAVGIAHVDSFTGRFIQVNNQYCKLLGYSQEEIQELNYQTLTHPDDLIEDLSSIDELRAGRIENYSAEKRYISKDGNVIWINSTVSPLLKKDGKVISHISIIENISTKKEAEDLIKKSEIRFKSLFEDYPIALWEKDFSQVKNYLKQLDLLNKSPEIVKKFLKANPEVVTKCMSLIRVVDVNNMCINLHSAKTKQDVIEGFQQLLVEKYSCDFAKHIIAITQGQNEIIADTIIKTASGETRDVKYRWSVISGFEESLERTIASTEDITVQKNNENLIKKSQQRIESLINTIDGIVWECEAASLSHTFISPKVKNILGYTPEEWMADSAFWQNHIYDDDNHYVQSYTELKMNQNLDHDFEYRMIAKDGSIVWLRDIVNVVIENDKALSLRGIMIDITKTKEAEKELSASFDLVTEQNKRLLNFSYIISHNLRSHTSNIQSIISLIETEESEDEKEQLIQLLKTTSDSLNETMFHLNEVINIRANIDLVSEPLDLEKYISSARNVLCEQITSNEVTIFTDVPEGTVINYNPAYLESILFNLISNSIRYKHPSKKPVINIKLVVENNIKILEIADNGIGIDLVRNGDKIFGMYKTFSNNADSKGLGLFITKNQVDAMGGNITVESEPNKGTTFKIYIL